MSRSLASIGIVLVSTAVVAAGGGCRKRAPAPATAARTPDAAARGGCPSPAVLVAMVAESGRTVRVDCAPVPATSYWMAVALSYREAAAEGADPRVSLLSGGAPGSKVTAFDVAQAPAGPIGELVRAGGEVRASIALASSGSHLLRLGVSAARPAGGDTTSDEIVTLLRLVAHRPPEFLWAGRGDRTAVSEDGCLHETKVEFQMLFSKRLEQVTSHRSSARKGAGGQASCPSGPASQEGLPFAPVPLGAGRTLTPG